MVAIRSETRALKDSTSSPGSYEPALHVAGTASVEQISLQVAREWIPSPRGRVARIHGVGVGVEQDRASVPCPGDVRSILVRDLFPNVIAVRFRLLASSLPRIYVEAALREGAPDDGPTAPVTEGTRTSSRSRLTASSRLACTAPRMVCTSPSSNSTMRSPFLFPVTRHRSMRLFSRQRLACLTRCRCVISIVILERGFEREDPVPRDVVPS